MKAPMMGWVKAQMTLILTTQITLFLTTLETYPRTTETSANYLMMTELSMIYPKMIPLLMRENPKETF